MYYPDSVEYLYALGNEMKSAKFGLDRMQLLLAGLGNPQLSYQVVHVAGTNGKGSTCAMIAAGLQAQGYRTGLYSSPHLLQPTERIRIQDDDITQDAFVAAFQRVHGVAEAMMARGELDAHPSYFETLTAMGFWALQQAGAERAVVEAGLGGRLDATNAVRPVLSVITPISFDHESWLGHSIESIAREKAGILKPGVPGLTSAQSPEALAILEDQARMVGAPLHQVTDWELEDLEILPDGLRFGLRCPRALPTTTRLAVECPLRGAFQAQNAQTAAAALDLLSVPGSAIHDGIRGVRWRGRLEKIATRPDVYLDGAHNPAGCAALADYIRLVKGRRQVWLVFGVMRDKAVSEMASHLFPLADHLVLTAPRQARALRPEALAEEATGQPLTLAPDIESAIAIVRQVSPEDLVFVAGSLFLVAEAAACFSGPTAS